MHAQPTVLRLLIPDGHHHQETTTALYRQRHQQTTIPTMARVAIVPKIACPIAKTTTLASKVAAAEFLDCCIAIPIIGAKRIQSS